MSEPTAPDEEEVVSNPDRDPTIDEPDDDDDLGSAEPDEPASVAWRRPSTWTT